jgi:hypothetical protein
METSTVRNRLNLIIDNAKRLSAERRTRNDEATRAFERFRESCGVPLFKQVAGALKASGYPFTVFTPGGSVKLLSDKSAEDYLEISLDTTGDQPAVVGHVSRARGRRVIESERPIAIKPVAELTEEDLLDYVLQEIGPFVER